MRRVWVVVVATIAVIAAAGVVLGAPAPAGDDGSHAPIGGDDGSDARVAGDAPIADDARVAGDARVTGDTSAAGSTTEAGVATPIGSPDAIGQRDGSRRGRGSVRVRDGPAVATPPGEPVSVRVNATYGVDETVTVTVSGTERRNYVVYVYDASGDDVVVRDVLLRNATQDVTLGVLDSGSYRIVVQEAYTATRVSKTFGVGGQYEPGVVPEIVVDEPADVVSIPITLPNGTTRTTITLQNDDADYQVRGTVVDRDGDGVVTLAWNTYYAGRGPVSLAATGSDTLENAARTSDRDDPLPQGTYHVTVTADGDRLDRGAIVLTLEPLYQTQIDVYEAPPLDSPMASFAARAASSTVETDEWAFVVVHTEGIFGAVNSTADLRSVGPDQVLLTIEPRDDDGGPIRLSAADYVDVQNGRIVVGFAPGNPELSSGTGYSVEFLVTRAHPYRAGDESTKAHLNVVPAGSEPDRPVFDIASVDAPAAVDADAFANVTVTIVNQGERTGDTTVTVSIGGRETTRNVTLPGRGTKTVDLAFDTGRVVPGVREYVVRVNDSTVNGTIQIGTDDGDGPTLVAGDRNEDGAIPGFSLPAGALAVAITALFARRHASDPES